MSARKILTELQSRIDELEGGTARRVPSARQGSATPMGSWDLLDGLVPGVGLGRGASVEVVGGGSSGKVALALRWLTALTSAGSLAAWVDLPGTFYPPAASFVGVVLSKLLVVTPSSSTEAAHAVGVALSSGMFEAVVLDWGPVAHPLTEASVRRLCARARQGRCTLYLLTTGSRPQLGGRADVRLRHLLSDGARQFCVERARPPSLDRAPWVELGAILPLHEGARCVEPQWEPKP